MSQAIYAAIELKFSLERFLIKVSFCYRTQNMSECMKKVSFN